MNTRTESLKTLYASGAHLFAFDVDRSGPKKIYNMPRDWQNTRSTLGEVLEAKHVGLIPASIGVIVADIDMKFGGSIGEKIEAVEKWAGKTPTIIRTPGGGAHMFYKQDEARGKVLVGGILPNGEKLEIFGKTGFVELHDI